MKKDLMELLIEKIQTVFDNEGINTKDASMICGKMYRILHAKAKKEQQETTSE